MPARDAPSADWRLTVALAVVAAALAIMGVVLAASALSSPSARPALQVSQHGLQFRPGAISIDRGDTVRVINDDGEVRHHAYVTSPQFSFDSGDQEPGHHSDITFTIAGHFPVLCAIHPRMRLDVDVK